MIPILLAGPQREPLSVDDMRQWLQLDTRDDDDLLAAMIKAARSSIEQAIRRALMLQKWRVRAQEWPRQGGLQVPLSPLLSLDAVRVFDAAGTPSLVDLSHFDVADSLITLRLDEISRDLFTFGVELDVSVGYGAQAADVPEPLRQAMRMLIAHWLAFRSQALHEGSVTHFPPAIAGAIMPYRQLRLR